MTGVLQTHSRKYKTAVDKLSFKFKILNPNKDLMSSPPVVSISFGTENQKNLIIKEI